MIRLGNAPCSWGTIEGYERAPVGYAQMLDELVEAGYHGTELGDYGFMPTDPAALRHALESRGLTLLGAYEGVDLRDRNAHEEGETRVLRTARLLASVADVGDPQWRPQLVLADRHSLDPERFRRAGRIGAEHGLDDGGWQVFAQGVEQIARSVRYTADLPMVFHPHCAGFVETPDEIGELLDRTDPDLLGIVFDTGHYLYGSGRTDGETVLEGLERFADRIRYVHFKDCDPEVASRARHEGWDYTRAVGAGVFCELGRGSIDFGAVLAALRQRGYDGWITVEQDVLPGQGEPLESARRNRAHLAGLGL